VSRTSSYSYSTPQGGGGGTGFVDIQYTGMSSLAVNGSADCTGITVQSTDFTTPVNVVSGPSPAESVFVQSNESRVDIDTDGGRANVTLGLNGIMAGIRATVNVHDSAGTGSAALFLEDENDTAPRTVTVDDGSVTGFSDGTVQWTTAPNAPTDGGVQVL